MTSKASAIWRGGLKDGRGEVSTASGALSAEPYGFNTRFGGEKGVDPEELIGAAHASCFAMALSNELGQVGLKADSIDARAEVFLEQKDGGLIITKSNISVDVKVDGDADKFDQAVEAAKKNCPVSKVLKAAITVTVSRT